jgi:hypothetical protein
MHRTAPRAAGLVAALAAILLAVGPAWAAKPPDAGSGGSGGGPGNQGAVKVVNADTGLESTTDNEPHVCGFYLHFHDAPDGASGTWTIVDWPPTGSGDEVAAGTYAIPPGGSYETEAMDFAAGHYRVMWQAINAQTEKHKTFWVDEGCDAGEQVDEQPVEEPPVEEPPVEEPPVEEEQPVEEQPVEEPPVEEEQPVEEPPVEEEQPEEQPEEAVEESIQEPPAEEEQPDQQPEQDQEPSLEEQNDVEQPADPESDLAPSITDEPIVEELPDTAMSMPETLPGLGAAIGLLLLVVVHRLVLDRGRRSADRS